MDFTSPRFDSIRRAIRTFIHVFVGLFVTFATPVARELINAVMDKRDVIIDFGFLRGAVIAAAFSGFIAAISLAHNAMEDAGALPAFLKGKASSGADPEPTPAPDVHDDYGF